jgi:hypothetical protein
MYIYIHIEVMPLSKNTRDDPAACILVHLGGIDVNIVALPPFPNARSRSDDTAGTCIRTSILSANGKARSLRRQIIAFQHRPLLVSMNRLEHQRTVACGKQRRLAARPQRSPHAAQTIVGRARAAAKRASMQNARLPQRVITSTTWGRNEMRYK